MEARIRETERWLYIASKNSVAISCAVAHEKICFSLKKTTGEKKGVLINLCRLRTGKKLLNRATLLKIFASQDEKHSLFPKFVHFLYFNYIICLIFLLFFFEHFQNVCACFVFWVYIYVKKRKYLTY